MKKKMIAMLLAVTTMLTVFAGMPLSASAETEGIWEYTVTDGEATITGCTDPVGNLTIPDTLGGYPVTEIGERAFFGCDSLTSITIPNSVTSISEYAFAWCESLTPIIIPSGVTTIGAVAFMGCEALTSIRIPDSVTSIGGGAFAYCTALTAIHVDENNTVYYSVDGVLMDKINHVLVRYPAGKPETQYTISDDITGIGGSAFSDCYNLNYITLPDGITTIDTSAFYCFFGLTSIVIPDSVTHIGNSAFEHCYALNSITLSNNLTEIGDYAFGGISGLTTITIPESVTSISGSAFIGCDNLTIYGYDGSYAEEYATANDIPFVVIGNQPVTPPDDNDDPVTPPTEPTVGDLDGTGMIDVADILKIKDLIMKESWDDSLLELGDLDNSGILDVGDIMALKNLIMGK